MRAGDHPLPHCATHIRKSAPEHACFAASLAPPHSRLTPLPFLATPHTQPKSEAQAAAAKLGEEREFLRSLNETLLANQKVGQRAAGRGACKQRALPAAATARVRRVLAAAPRPRSRRALTSTPPSPGRQAFSEKLKAAEAAAAAKDAQIADLQEQVGARVGRPCVRPCVRIRAAWWCGYRGCNPSPSFSLPSPQHTANHHPPPSTPPRCAT